MGWLLFFVVLGFLFLALYEGIIKALIIAMCVFGGIALIFKLLDIIPSEKHDDGGEKNWYQRKSTDQKIGIWISSLFALLAIYGMIDDLIHRGSIW
jgi:hypothetical protein